MPRDDAIIRKNLDVVLAEIGPHVRRDMLRYFRPDSPIAATRLAVALVEQLRLAEGYPLSVQLSIYNRAMIIRSNQEGGLPHTRKVAMRWAKECNAWSLGLGYPSSEQAQDERWPGHLVAIIGRRWLWDLSIDQANRPEYDIVFRQPALLAVSEKFLRGREQLIAWWANCLLVYDAKPEDKSFRESSTWNTDFDIALKGRLTVGAAIDDLTGRLRWRD